MARSVGRVTSNSEHVLRTWTVLQRARVVQPDSKRGVAGSVVLKKKKGRKKKRGGEDEENEFCMLVASVLYYSIHGGNSGQRLYDGTPRHVLVCGCRSSKFQRIGMHLQSI